MVFVTVGTQKFQFDRLLKAVDEAAGEGAFKGRVFAQTGHSTYKMAHCESEAFIDRDRFADLMQEADLVITHGGTGVIVAAVKQGKKVIAVPRRAAFGEHVDDHQAQIVSAFKEKGIICALSDTANLKKAVRYAERHSFNGYESHTKDISDSIDGFLREM